MSFKPFGFTYTPPPTVPSPAPTSVPVVSTITNVGVGGVSSGASSIAGKLISQLNDLTAMSQYLQDAIVARTGKTAIEINPAIDPNTARALASIYGTELPPSFITIEMYDQLLDAHMGALQLEMTLGNNSTIQPNPIQVADLMTTTGAVTEHLINSPSFNNWLPLNLTGLKADTIVFQSWAQALSTYPAYYSTQSLAPSSMPTAVIQAATLDISPDLAVYQIDAIIRISQTYTNLYQSMTMASAVEQDAGSIMSVFFVQPLANMVRIVSLLRALSGLSHMSNMKDLMGDLTNYTFARLASDSIDMTVSCDQLVALSVNPLRGSLGSLNAIIAGAEQQAAVAGFVAQGALEGISNANACATSSQPNKAPKTLTIPGLGKISEGLKQLAETLNWAQNKATGGLSLLDKSFRQLLERRISQQNNTQSLMCSMKALDTLVGLAVGTVNEFQKGTLTSNATPQQQQEAANRILTSLQTGSNTTFVASGNQIIVNPPDMPAVTEPVQRVLSTGKVRTTLGSIQS